MTTTNRHLVFDDEPQRRPEPAPAAQPAPSGPIGPPVPPYTAEQWAALSASDRLDREVAAAAARAQQGRGMAEQPRRAPLAQPPLPAPEPPVSDPAGGESIVVGTSGTVEVKTVIYRAFVELDDGLARAIPPGVQLAPTSMSGVVREVQRRAMLLRAEEDAQDRRALAEVAAMRAPTGRLAIVQQDPPLALPAPDWGAAAQQDAAPQSGQQMIVSLAEVERDPNRFVAVDLTDPRVQQLLAARQPISAAPAAALPGGGRGSSRAITRAAIILLVVLLLANIPFTAPYVRRGGGWLKTHTIDRVLHRLPYATPEVVPVKAGDPDEFVFKRAPSITCGQFAAAMAGTPVAPEAIAVCQVVARAGYDPAIMATMAKISMQDTSADAQQQWQPAPAGGYNPFFLIGSDKKPLVFGDYAEGFAAFADALEHTYAPQGIVDLAGIAGLTCPPARCDSAAYLKTIEEAARAVRALPDPAGATPAPTSAPVAGATPAPDTVAGGTAPIAERSSGPLRLTVSDVTVADDGKGGQNTHVKGIVTNISADKTIIVPAAAFVFTANGVPYTIANGQVSTVGPGQSAPFEIGVPVPEHQSLSLSLTVQDASIQLELRK